MCMHAPSSCQPTTQSIRPITHSQRLHRSYRKLLLITPPLCKTDPIFINPFHLPYYAICLEGSPVFICLVERCISRLNFISGMQWQHHSSMCTIHVPSESCLPVWLHLGVRRLGLFGIPLKLNPPLFRCGSSSVSSFHQHSWLAIKCVCMFANKCRVKPGEIHPFAHICWIFRVFHRNLALCIFLVCAAEQTHCGAFMLAHIYRRSFECVLHCCLCAQQHMHKLHVCAVDRVNCLQINTSKEMDVLLWCQVGE